MTCYLICCHLKGSDYNALHAKMREWNAESMLPASWIADVNEEASEMRDTLLGLIGPDDGLAIIQVRASADWAAVGTLPDSMALLQRNADCADRGAGCFWLVPSPSERKNKQ
jgi:hypothetical protein